MKTNIFIVLVYWQYEGGAEIKGLFYSESEALTMQNDLEQNPLYEIIEIKKHTVI